nr:cation-translocating P-type ATPase [Paenibacillus sp. 1001270B_150601_E10]
MKVVLRYKNQLTAISFLLIAIGFLLGAFGYEEWHKFAFVLATIIAGGPIVMKAYQSIRMRVFSIELLVTIAVIGALVIGEYSESAVVTFLFLFGDYLELRTLTKTRSSLKELMDLALQEAEVIRNGEQVLVPVDEVVKGERVVIRSGGKIPVDGKIVTGQASMNESAVTGESVPVFKKENDQVYSGSMVDHGYVEIIAERVGEDTTFAKIIELVEEAQESKSQTEKFLQTFARYYTPAVVALSIMVFILTREIRMAITFLVIACPGALVIDAPVSNVAGIGNGAKHGILVKGGEVMERFSKVDTVVFDKTGTLTKGKPVVTNIKAFRPYDENELLRLAAVAEMSSEHHLGQAIVQEAKARNFMLVDQAVDVDIMKGNGLYAKVNGMGIMIGNHKWLASKCITIPLEIEEEAVRSEKRGNTVVFAVVEGQLAGFISIADQLREEVSQAIAELRENGIKHMVMLTGDNEHVAKLVADQLDIDEIPCRTAAGT